MKKFFSIVFILLLIQQANSGPFLGMLGYGGCMATCIFGGQSVKIVIKEAIKKTIFFIG
jgi:hypothetical protein